MCRRFFSMENWIFVIRDIIDEAAGVKTLVLARRNGEPTPYQAGQFLTLLFSSHGHDLRRSYSFSSAPGVDAFPAITVKRVINGEVSRHLLDRLRVGDVLTALPPAGRFTLDVAGEGAADAGEGAAAPMYIYAHLLPPAPPVFDATPKAVRVRGAVDQAFTVKWPESILTAALRQGVPLPYSCRAGRCSSCVARCLKGSVRMTHNEVLTEKDLREGLVLTCVGYAETDVELSYARSAATKASGSREPDSGMT